MTDLRTAAQHTLDALEGGADSWQLVGPAIDALKAALAEPMQDPVAWMYEDTLPKEYPYDAMWSHSAVRDGVRMFPVFAPPQRKPLTREKAIALWADKSDGPSNGEIVSYCRAIERAHGIGGNDE